MSSHPRSGGGFGGRSSRAPGASRGRGRGGSFSYSSRANPAPEPLEPERLITEDIGNFIESISLDERIEHPLAKVEQVIPVASYDWIDKASPTIAVPGSPRVWTNKKLPFQCPKDTKMQYVDQSAFRCPKSPLTPLIAAVQFWNPEFDLSEMDIVTDRNGLRKLFRWATGSKDDFRIDLQRAGNGTVLLSRWQSRSRLGPGFGFGHEFEHLATKVASGLLPTEGHHRIVTYDFADLRLLVRFEVDACYSSVSEPSLDDLISQTTSLSLSSGSGGSKESRVTNGVTVVPSGTALVKQKDLIELVTRSTRSRENFEWSEVYPQLYLSNTPTLLLGVHDSGTFSRIEKFGTDDVANEEIRQSKEMTQFGMNKVAAVLNAIRDSVLPLTDGDASGDRRDRLLSLIFRDGELKLYERKGDKKLPEELLKAFN